jgi:UDP-N-acetylmuramate--alanine ligase
VFQPHLFSRTRDLAGEFGKALLGADFALVTDIYPSREEPIPEVDSTLVVDAARRSGHRHVELCGDWHEARRFLVDEVDEGDVVLTLGAGDIYRLAEQLASEEAA